MLEIVSAGDTEVTDYLINPSKPILCLEDLAPADGDAASGMHLWTLRFHDQLLDDLGITTRFKKPADAAFTSMPNSEGMIVGGRGQNHAYNGLTQKG